MKALVYLGPGSKVLQDRPKPSLLQTTDAIVKIIKTTICGTDLHILKGDVPSCAPGRILGHEGIGFIEEVGSAVTGLKPGDKVLISCITSCGKCEYCKKSMFSHCINGGWLLGNQIDGTQAEYVRIPFADTSLHKIADSLDEDSVVMLSDIFPTGFECGVLNGKVKPGSSVAIVGAGPIGLASLLTAQFFSPAEVIMIDVDPKRLAVAGVLGASHLVNSHLENPTDAVMTLTQGRGVDTAIEAVGIPETFELCEKIIAPGGVIANVGVHGVKADIFLQNLWSRNITITTGLVDTYTTPMLLKVLAAKKFNPTQLITHYFTLDKIMDAYETFAGAMDTEALKVIIKA